jgi:hypothetical protein
MLNAPFKTAIAVVVALLAQRIRLHTPKQELMWKTHRKTQSGMLVVGLIHSHLL